MDGLYIVILPLLIIAMEVCLILILILINTIRKIIKTHRISKTGIETKAVVISIDIDKKRLAKFVDPKIQYQTANKKVEKMLEVTGLWRNWKVGDVIKIKYDPKNVEECYIIKNSFIQYFTTMIFFIIFMLPITSLVYLFVILPLYRLFN